MYGLQTATSSGQLRMRRLLCLGASAPIVAHIMMCVITHTSTLTLRATVLLPVKQRGVMDMQKLGMYRR